MRSLATIFYAPPEGGGVFSWVRTGRLSDQSSGTLGLARGVGG
ncbi:hypothetical protein PLANPX_6196 [Lacipirellula parvula]|uniref:Uncharacterized protein n=1 Tax=Lacipirellula parvula TaxID=2650471 RepID=A0A5K7XI62_9BACT|nr:hypothetical protein PLANPX_6196 [Lacipirellula parvula]